MILSVYWSHSGSKWWDFDRKVGRHPRCGHCLFDLSSCVRLRIPGLCSGYSAGRFFPYELSPNSNSPDYSEGRPTPNPLCQRGGPVGPNVCCAGQDSRSRGDFFVQSCLPTRGGLDRRSRRKLLPAKDSEDFE